eukprot:4664980-Amphidinium_carterae.1
MPSKLCNAIRGDNIAVSQTMRYQARLEQLARNIHFCLAPPLVTNLKRSSESKPLNPTMSRSIRPCIVTLREEPQADANTKSLQPC